MKILTGIDLPFLPSCGSTILANDLYGNIGGDNSVRFLALKSREPSDWSKISDIYLLNIKKETSEAHFSQYVLRLSREIDRHIKEFEPDIIHIQHLSFGMATAFSKKKLPKIAICHGTGIEFAINSHFHQRNVNRIIRSSSRIIFPTRSMYEISGRFFPVFKNLQCDIVPWGIPLGDVGDNKKKDYKSKDKIRLLYAGRLTANKSVDTIINSLSLLDSKITLTIIGSGDQLDNLVDLARKLRLESRIEFIPFMNRDKLWKILTEFDICIISTKTVEAFCLMAVEAQAHGLIVVYSDTGGPKDIIGNSGIMFKAGDFSDLSKKIQYLISNNDVMNRFIMLSIKNAKKYKIENLRKRILYLSKLEISKFNRQNNG